MNLYVIIGIVVVMIALRLLRLNMLGWLFAWWIAVYVGARYGIQPPMPSSIVNMFMAITTMALFTYIFADAEKIEATKRPLVNFIVEKKFAVPLAIVVITLPLLVGYKTYVGMSKDIAPPVFGRTVHPAPPDKITFNGKNIDLISGVNPHREPEESDPATFAEYTENGRRVYYQNCVFCHGDDMDGDGIYAHALDPIPANLKDATTIGMLQETYLFWRIAKGASGLPDEGGPWASAMPAWETFLTEEEIWDVILYLYDRSGQRPRAAGHGDEH